MRKQFGSPTRSPQRVWVIVLVLLLLQTFPLYGQRAVALDGPWGTVKDAKGPLEGIGVQLISTKTGIRTTVYSNEEGMYRFPALDSGTYTLRVPRPMEFKPWVRESVKIDGKSAQLETVSLERVTEAEVMPPEPEIVAQLTGAEWMLNLPGTGEEKRNFTLTCGFGCHSYQQIFRNRYDEASWRILVRRMLRGEGSPLINQREVTPQTRGRAGRALVEEEELTIKWLAKVRGPESQDPPLYFLPRPRGRSTRVVVTEYELPRTLLAPHDVHGDSQGNIWYTAHRSPYAGVLNPRTGEVKEYRIPEKEKDTPGALPGTHRVWVDKNDIVWFSEQWDHYLTALDASTGKIMKRFHFPEASRINSTGMSNFALDDNGYVYETFQGSVVKIDTNSGKIVQKFPLPKIRDAYESIITPGGRYWAGSSIGRNLIGLLDTTTGELSELETRTPVSSGSRGAFDTEGNAWFGGRGGLILKLNPKTKRITEYFPPMPYVTFYEALPDKKGEIWAGALHSGRFLRFNPRTEQWIDYLLPEPFSHNRRTWIDNSTDPVTVWYVDQNGYIVRLQPLE